MVHFPLFLACLPACSRSADRCRHADRVRPPACRGCGAGRGEGCAAIDAEGVLDRSRNWPITTVKRQEMTLKRLKNVKKLAE